MMKRLHRNRDITRCNNDIDQKTNNATNDNVRRSSNQDIFDKIHCYFSHSYDQGYRLMDDDDVKNTDIKCASNQTNDDDNHINKQNKFTITQIQNYSFSQTFYYWEYFKNSDKMNVDNPTSKQKHWYIAPKYQSLKDELLNNEICTISVQQFHNDYDKATQYHQLDYSKTLVAKSIANVEIYTSSTNMMDMAMCYYNKQYDISSYGLTENSPIQIHHLMSIILYCSYSVLSFKFSETFRRIQTDGTNKETDMLLKQKHSNFHYFAKYLNESVNLFSKMAIFGKISIFYHGISQKMIFDHMQFITYQPFSTTSSWEVARTFGNNTGLILEISCDPATRYFDCGWLSDFSSEAELLFLRNYGLLTFENITNLSLNTDFREYINALLMIDLFFLGFGAFKNNVVQKYNKAIISNNPDQISHNPIMYRGEPIKATLKLLIIKLLKHELNIQKMENIHPYIQQLFHQMLIKKKHVLVDANLFDIEIYNQFPKRGFYQGYSFLKYLFFDIKYEMIKLDRISLLFPNASSITLTQMTPIKSTQIECILKHIQIIKKSKCTMIEIIVEDSKYNVPKNMITPYKEKFGRLDWYLNCVKLGNNTTIQAMHSTAWKEFKSNLAGFNLSFFSSYKYTNII